MVDLSSNDETLILASDGVFEFMSDEEVVDVVCNGNAADAEEACSQVCISVRRMSCPLKNFCGARHLQ